MTERRVYRMSDPVEPVPVRADHFWLAALLGFGIGYVLGRYL